MRRQAQEISFKFDAPKGQEEIIKNPGPKLAKHGEDMSEEKKEENPTPEELEEEKQEEEKLLATPDEAKVRSQIIEENELDEDVDSELIDRLTKKELKDRKSFGKVVGQKRKWREKAQKKPEKEIEKDKKPGEGVEKKGLTEAELDKRLDERERKRDLEALDVSDELKNEVESYAKLHNCSIKKAFGSDYIKFKKDVEDKQDKIDKAALGEGKRRTQTASSIRGMSDTALLKAIKDVDKSTEEGRKQHEELKKELKSRD